MRQNVVDECSPEPNWLVSKINLLRFRFRSVVYRLSYQKAPNAFDIINLLLAVIGAWTVIGYLAKWLGSLPFHLILGAFFVILFIAVVWLRRYAASFSTVFDRAALSAESAQRLHDDAVLGMRNSYAWDVLARIYFPMLESARAEVGLAAEFHSEHDRSKRPFLCAMLPAGKDQGLVGLVGPVVEESQVLPQAATFAESRQAYIRRLRNIDAFKNPLGDEEGDNLAVQSLSYSGENISITCGIATYGEIVRTSDALQNEFAVFGFLSSGYPILQRRQRRVGVSSQRHRIDTGGGLRLRVGDAMSVLPWRKQVHAWSRSPSDLFFRPVGRASGLGVSVAMVTDDGDGGSAFVAQRASNVGVYPDALHVVPSGMCNAKSDLRTGGALVDPEYVKWVMIQELLEECFDMQEMAQTRTFDWIGAVKSALKTRGLEDFDPIFTGLALDFLNLRWDICARVDVGDNGNRHDYRLCWEYNLTSDTLGGFSRR